MLPEPVTGNKGRPRNLGISQGHNNESQFLSQLPNTYSFAPDSSIHYHPKSKRVHAQSLIHAQLFLTPWTVACQAPLSVEFSRQEYWSELSFPSAGDLPDSGIKPASPALIGRFFTAEPQGRPRHPKRISL